LKLKLKFWEKFKGFFISGASTRRKRKFWAGEKSWLKRCRYYDTIYERHPLAKAQILTIAGQLCAQGIYIEPASVGKVHEARAKEAAERIRQLADEVGMIIMLYETAVGMAKYGSFFWEKTWTPKFDIRIIPSQEYIEPAAQDEIGNITKWRQLWYGHETTVWNADEIIPFHWNVTSKSWPYGTSLLVGLETEFEILEQLETDLKEYMHKQAFPKHLWKIGDENYTPTDSEIQTIKSKIKNWAPGDEFVTSYPIGHEVGSTGGTPVQEIAKVLEFLKDQCIDGLLVPPISKQWSSTMASAREMMPWARANLIEPMQRIISHVVENQVFKPYLEDLGYSVKVCPKLKWEPPEAHLDERVEMYATLVQSGIITPEVAAMELGYGDLIEEMRKQREERAQLRKVMFQQKKMEEPKEESEE